MRLAGRIRGGLVPGVLLVVACPGDDSSAGPEPLFPADYEASYVEVRNCRGSGDHDLNNIRILADPVALPYYQDRQGAFPEGAVVIKEEYDFGDTTCEGELKQWTVMRKLAADASPDTLDWEWQRVDEQRRVVGEDEMRCISCHTGCGVPPDGFDWTCSIPP
ncbi:MAG: cytochrome P460 family protein [Myxococcales bacterium]|nr:cytochrome P460 family protein [Myxococcales bacterium]MCB9719059.1 cytochrome P460 family protein [Myxococcales bacterium]